MESSKEQGTLTSWVFQICNNTTEKCRRKKLKEKGKWKGIFLAKGEGREYQKVMAQRVVGAKLWSLNLNL